MPVPNQMAQACHASAIGERWSGTMIILQCKDEEHLLHLNSLLNEEGIKTFLFYEPDFPVGYSAFSTEPVEKSKVLRRLKLWEGKDATK